MSYTTCWDTIVDGPGKARLARAFLRFGLWRPGRTLSRSAGMKTYKSQFRAIVGHNYTPSKELDADQARSLTAPIFSMPETEVMRDGEFIEYEGWSFGQNVYLSVTVISDHRCGAQAICAPLDQFDE